MIKFENVIFMRNLNLGNLKLKQFLFYFITPFILILPAIYNGYPLVYSDTGTYLRSGIELIIPPDRPIMYGLFIQCFDLNFTLWPVIYVQSFFTTFLLWNISKVAYPSFSYLKFIIILLPLSFFSGLGWYVSQLMPDIFTFIAIGSLFLLLFQSKKSILNYVIYSVLLILSVNVHFSNFPIVLLTLFVSFFILRYYLKSKQRTVNFILPISILFFSLIIGSLTNLKIGNTVKINQGSHVYLMGKMLDSGVLKSFLDDKCKNNNYVLCACKDSLPKDNRELLWSYYGPLYKHGGWENSSKEYTKILTDLLTSPKHLSLVVYNSFTSTLTQLFQNDLGSGLISEWYRAEDSPPSIEIKKHYQFELNQYYQSRQNGNLWGQELKIDSTNFIYKVLLYLSIFILILLFSIKKLSTHINDSLKGVIIFLCVSVVSNAFIVASLANIYDRLQARISWIFIFSILLIFLSCGKKILLELRHLYTPN